MRWIQATDTAGSGVAINPQQITHMKRIHPSNGKPAYTIVYFGYATGDHVSALHVQNDVDQLMQLSG